MPLDGAEEQTWSGRTAAAADGEWRAVFAETIESEIVPQLLALTDGEPAPPAKVDQAAVDAIADAAVCHENGVVMSHVLAYTAKGHSYADALLNLVAPAARRLGDDWDTDRRDFMDVTVGLGTLHQVVSSLSSEFVRTILPDRRILLGPTPGEHHTFGLALVDHFFRAARWDVDLRPYADRAELVAAVADDWYAVVGLSLSGDPFVDEAAATVRVVRAASANPSVRVLVGGPAFLRKSALATYVSADAVATDAQAAVEIANTWLAEGSAGHRQ
ncbi:MAG: cobalamin B12-binding domain-containing protein [Pseudomonadota bacterium]